MSMYQERKLYYNTLLTGEYHLNSYMNVYECVHDLHNNLHKHGMHFFDHENDHINRRKAQLWAIREMEGLGRSWGHAREVLELLAQWSSSVNRNVCAEEMTEALDALLNSILEVLPAYVKWVPQAKVTENQPIINFLQARGNTYRKTGNRKFYAYDRVVTAIATTDIRVNTANCVYIKGVGPRISKHIRDFLNSPVEPTEQWFEQPEMPDRFTGLCTFECVWRAGECNCGGEEETPFEHCPLCSTLLDPSYQACTNEECDALGEIGILEKQQQPEQPEPEMIPETIFNAQELPNVLMRENVPLATYLWEKAHEFRQQGFTGTAWAWLRVCRTICDTEYCVQNYLERLEMFPFVGEMMADVICEFYQYYGSLCGVSQSDSPPVAPVSSLSDELARFYQQQLIDLLWENDYCETAHEVARMDRVPQIRADFRALETYSEQMLNIIFTSIGNIPVADNWINQKLTDWLWSAGNNCPSVQGINYYNGARAVARKKNIVEYENLPAVKYMGPYITERVGAEFFGRIEPSNYTAIRRKLNQL